MTPDKNYRNPILAICELAEKARIGGLYYFVGVLVGGLLSPEINIRGIPFALFLVALAVPLALREYAYRLSKKESALSQASALRVIEFCYLANAILWTAFTVFLLYSAGVISQGAAATIVACAGIAAGGVTATIPHNRLINWYCFFMLAVPGLSVPFLIHGPARWYLAIMYFFYYYYMMKLGERQSSIYWQLRDHNTALQQYSTELEVARKEALAGSKAKSEFLAKMSHEIRTPMNGVLGIAQLLENTPLNARQQKYVHIIRDSGEVLLRIIDDVLDFSKLEVDKMLLHPAPIDLPQLIADMRDIFALQLHDKPVQLITHHQGEFPQQILVDPIRIRQILYNLISNAVKFTQQGNIIIDLEFHPSGETGIGRVKCSITDSGIGIHKDLQPQVFTQFEQFSTQPSVKGTGLGLAICKKLVEVMGGEIGFHSTLQVGSHFWFEIPAAIVDENMSSIKLNVNEPVEVSSTRGLSALVVEDDSVNQLVIQHQLEYLGHQALVVDRGEFAITALQERNFDLIFMDYNLPEMSGAAVTKIIRRWEQENNKKRIPIIGLTAHTQNNIKQDCLDAGMDDYLSKPVKAVELRQAIARWATSASDR